MPKRRPMPMRRRREALAMSTLVELLTAAGRARWPEGWAWVRDYNEADGWVVYDVEANVGGAWTTKLYRIGFTVTDTEPVAVTLLGEPEHVVADASYAVAESRRVDLDGAGRVLEAKGNAADGSRVWRVVVIEAGESLNGRLYDGSVLEAATELYDGAKVYNRHRTLDELQTSTTEGLVGYLRAPAFTGAAIEADLHLFASASHLAEALDASVAVQADGLPPIVGLSHDALAEAALITVGGRTLEQVRRIEAVLSTDIVADPASGGRAVRVVAGGVTDPTPTTHSTTPPESQETDMDRLRELTIKHKAGTLTAEERDELATLLDAELGLTLDDLAAPAGDADEDATADDTVAEPVAAGVTEGRRYSADSYEGRAIIATAVGSLPPRVREAVEARVPARFTEADLRNLVEPAQAVASALDLVDTLGNVRVPVATKVTKEARDKLVERLDRTLEGAHPDGFRSFREMFAAFNPDVRPGDLEGGDFASVFLAESYRGFGRMGTFADRVSEAIDSTTFAQVLGDSVRRRMVAEYSLSPLSNWRQIVSAIETLTDFRTQRIGRLGGYGTLSTVAQGDPYAALTSPGDEEATYAAAKRGGTESITLEMIANDDMRAFRAIPIRMGRAAAQTLYRYVWGLITANPTMSYDSVALFHASHGNLGTTALSATSLAAARLAMRKQAAYGDSAEVLGYAPRFLVTPADLEETAFELTRSAVAVTAGKDATVPNFHAGMDLIVLPHLTDVNNWFAIADPALCPTIELGFYKGMTEPELFVQDMGNVGTMFDSDEVTLKVRHIYGGTVLDHRAFYGAIVA